MLNIHNQVRQVRQANKNVCTQVFASLSWRVLMILVNLKNAFLTKRQTNRPTDGPTDGPADGPTDGQTKGPTDGQTFI